MEILVRKPTEKEKEDFKKLPTWGCGISKFDWFYDSKETCILTEGEVIVTYGDKDVSFKAGDLVVFPAGLSCVWDVKAPVKKHFVFG